MNNKKHAVIGIGNAIVDIIIFVEDNFLAHNALFKGSMTLISKKEAEKFANLKYEKIISGGSAANAISCLTMTGIKTAFIGKVGNDEFGDAFADELQKNHIDFFCRQKGEPNSTAKSFILVSPDGQRTMATYLGCASDINEEIDETAIAESKILYLEGYLWDKAPTIEALKKAIFIAKNNHTKVAFNLSDSFCVIRHKSEFLELAKDLDILFSNEPEIRALLDLEKIENKKIVDFAQKNNLILALTRSEKGAIIFDGNNSGKFYEVPTHEINPIDSTGAGDCFAAGFLYGLNKNDPLEKCAAIGNAFAGKVITKIGARLDENEIKELQYGSWIIYDTMEGIRS